MTFMQVSIIIREEMPYCVLSVDFGETRKFVDANEVENDSKVLHVTWFLLVSLILKGKSSVLNCSDMNLDAWLDVL